MWKGPQLWPAPWYTPGRSTTPAAALGLALPAPSHATPIRYVTWLSPLPGGRQPRRSSAPGGPAAATARGGARRGGERQGGRQGGRQARQAQGGKGGKGRQAQGTARTHLLTHSRAPLLILCSLRACMRRTLHARTRRPRSAHASALVPMNVTLPGYHPYQAPSSLSMLLGPRLKSPPRPIAPRLRAEEAFGDPNPNPNPNPNLSLSLSLSLTLTLTRSGAG